MNVPTWRNLITLAWAALLLATLGSCGGRPETSLENELETPTAVASLSGANTPVATVPVANTPVASSPLPPPLAASAPGMDESLILILPNGDVVLYTLVDQRSIVLLEQAYIFDDSEMPTWTPDIFPLRPSPDGKWLIVPTPDQGTWLVATDGSSQRQISPTLLSATWAPDSQQIAYIGPQSDDLSSGTLAGTPENNTPDYSVLYTQNIVAGDAPQPLLKPEASMYTSVWSPGCTSTPPPPGSSCGQHIFLFSRQDNPSQAQDGDEPLQAMVVDVTTGEVTQLGPYAGPGREVSPAEFRWSPAGDEFWVPGPYTMEVYNIAFQTDGSTPRLLVAACDVNCIWEDRNGEVKTEGGWTLHLKPGSTNEEISAKSPTGEEFEVVSAAYFAGTLARGSTEVGDAEAEVVPLLEYLPSDLWNQRVMQDVGVSYRLPPNWQESGSDQSKLVQNYRLGASAGMVSLGDGAMNLYIDATQSNYEESPAALFQEWLASNEGVDPEQPLPNFILNDYDRRYYLVEGELITFADHPAVRLHSAMLPFAEQIVVPLKNHLLKITISPAIPEPVLDEILASFVLPDDDEEEVAP